MGKFKKHGPYYLSILVMVLLVAIYFFLRRFDASDAAEIIVTVLAIVAGVAFWLEYHRNSQINEAQFNVELNNQFLNDEKMTKVEHRFEQYFYLVKNGRLDEAAAFEKEMERIYDIENDERQDLVNYLVHLEGIAALIADNVIRLRSINDLMGYRYFLATNNPVVQRIELEEYREFYKGIYGIYPEWVRIAGDDIPLKDHLLIADGKGRG